MKLTDSKKKEYIKKIAYSRLRVLNNHGFYGLLLMHMSFGLDEEAKTAYTDGHKICFSPEFLDELKDSELDFVLMHEILHVVLKHCFRGKKYDNELFNIACDIVVNSNILKSCDLRLSSISIDGKPMMHEIDSKEGYEYTAEEVYQKLLKDVKKIDISSIRFDDHSHWEELEGEGNEIIDEWEERLLNAIEALQIKNSSQKRGEIPVGAYRMYEALKESTVNWEMILKNFITFEVADYSFNPPDRRYDEFFLPDFNEQEENASKNILFEVDTSGSISDKDLASAYSEIKGAIDASSGTLKGWLGFYDTKAYDIKRFEDVDEMLKIKPVGGGGTSVSSVFQRLDYFSKVMGSYPDAIIIITDGYDIFPKEEVRKDIPVLWIINNNNVTPPWGMLARIKSKKK